MALDCINKDQNIDMLKKNFSNSEINQSNLLSLKPKLYVCNVDEKNIKTGNDYTRNFINKYEEKLELDKVINNIIDSMPILIDKKLDLFSSTVNNK